MTPEDLAHELWAIAQSPAAVSEVTALIAVELRAYALANRAAERERIKERLLAMDDAVTGRHNYYAHAAFVLFGETP
jgi:hypothetical protein